MKMMMKNACWLLLAASSASGQEDHNGMNNNMPMTGGLDLPVTNGQDSAAGSSTTTTTSEATDEFGFTTTTTTTTTTVTTTSNAERQPLLWSEEFNAASGTPDMNLWSYDVGSWGWGEGELQEYTTSSNNIAVNGGVLKITARNEGSRYTSARIKTEDKLSFRYGTVEIRAQWPKLNAGLWPAFWTMGTNFRALGWPRSGEIDIMQGGQGFGITQNQAHNRVVSAAHWDNDGTYTSSAKSYDATGDLTEGFHTYRMEWTPQVIQTFVDGQLVWSMNIDQDQCDHCEEFHQHHFMVLNMAIGGAFTSTDSFESASGICGSSSPFGSSQGCPLRGPNDISAPLPGEMEVDWIRLYNNGFSEVILGSGNVLVAQSGFQQGTTTDVSSTNVGFTTISNGIVCQNDVSCNPGLPDNEDSWLRWCEMETNRCLDRREGGVYCARDRSCWSNDCRSNTCRGGVSPSGFVSTVVTSGSTTLTQFSPVSDVTCNRDMDCDFDTQWCELATRRCYEKRSAGISCSRDRVCWGGDCRSNGFCRNGGPPAGYVSTSVTTGSSVGITAG